MLAEPKVRNIFGNEWIVEILRRPNPEKAPHPNHDIAVPGEVEIEKEVESINAQQQLARTHLGNGYPRWGYKRDQKIGQSVSLDTSHQDSQQGVKVGLEGEWNRRLPAIPLFPVIVVTLDRPHHESSEIEGVVDKYPEIEGAQCPASSLDHDMDDLEEKKAEAGGGQDLRLQRFVENPFQELVVSHVNKNQDNSRQPNSEGPLGTIESRVDQSIPEETKEKGRVEMDSTLEEPPDKKDIEGKEHPLLRHSP